MRRRLNTIFTKLTALDTGATIVEYALLIAFIAIVSIAVIVVIGTEASSVFDSAGQGFGN